MLARPHVAYGWLYLSAVDWRQTLQRSLDERDRLNDPNHVGAAPAFLQWARDVQMPQLLMNPRYRVQAEEHLTRLGRKLDELGDLLSRGRLDLQPQADAITAELRWLESLLAAVEVPS